MKYLALIGLFTLFLHSPVTLADTTRVNAGDLIYISLPGEESLNNHFTVDRRGFMYLPEVGALSVANLSEKELQQYVHDSLSEVFRDLSSLRVYIAERRLMITVLGYVEQPGEVVLAADSNIQAILTQAGGLRPGAQLDKLQLRRGDATIIFNYKQYLDSGDPNLLPDVHSLDSIFVPASPKTGNVETDFDPAKIADAGDAANARSAIKVFGEVNSPGSFSYLPNVSIVDLLMKAGGVTRYAGVERIRIISSGEPRIFDLKAYLDSGDAHLMPDIHEGSTLFVPRQEEAVKSSASTVYVMGEVFKPGAYEASDAVSFMDILANAGGPTRYAETRQIRVLKVSGEVQRFDLAAYTEGRANASMPKIIAGDAIFVPEKTDMNEKSWLKIAPERAVRVLGEVVRPGRVEWSDEMDFLDLIAHVGGPVSRADTSNIEILSPLGDGRYRNTQFNLDAYIRSGQSREALPKIVAGATIRIHDLPQDPADNKAQWVRQASEKSIYIFGQVGAPGRYMFTTDMNFLDILAAADGPTQDADLRNVRITHRNHPYAEVTRLNLSLYFETGDESLLPTVTMGDSIFIPEKEKAWLDAPKETTVRVLGEVHSPGRYTFDDSMTILDLLAEAGGPTADAHVRKILVLSTGCCQGKSRSFNLLKLTKTGKIKNLPVLRAGDTVYIPNKSDASGTKAREVLGDMFRVISLTALLGL